MNKTNLVACFTALVLLIGSCKKDNPNPDNNNNNNNTSPLGANAPTLPSDAAGALYAVLTNSPDGGGGVINSSTCFGWFVSYTSTANAGVVLCDADTLSTAIPFSNVSYPWYELSVAAVINGGDVPDFTSGTNVQWNVSGNGSVPAINYNDASQWPQVVNFNTASSISISAPLNITYAITGGSYKQVICSIKGSKATVSQVGAASSVTFSASQLATAATNSDNLEIEVMPVNYIPQTIGGKNYYFVKQNAFVNIATTTP